MKNARNEKLHINPQVVCILLLLLSIMDGVGFHYYWYY